MAIVSAPRPPVNPQHPPGELLTPKETARLLGVAPRTLRRWRAAGHVPGWVLFRPGRRSHPWFLRSQLERWLAGRTPSDL